MGHAAGHGGGANDGGPVAQLVRQHRRDELTHGHADGGGGKREHEILRQEHDCDHQRRSTDRLEQADAPGLLGHPAPDHDRDARDRQQRQERRDDQ